MSDTTLPYNGFTDTPILPASEWHVHDPYRPQPPIITSADPAALTPPSDAVVLFNGTDMSGWSHANGTPAGWKVENGYMEVVPGTGDIFSEFTYGSAQLHVEFSSPEVIKGESQGRGNSGVFVAGRYEIQVLDNYENPTYADGTVGAVYGQYPPLVNASRQPGTWQTYDIIYTAPQFGEDEALTSPAYLTVILNGVVVQNHTALMGSTGWRNLSSYSAHGPGPLKLQDHGDLVRFRNIWVRAL